MRALRTFATIRRRRARRFVFRRQRAVTARRRELHGIAAARTTSMKEAITIEQMSRVVGGARRGDPSAADLAKAGQVASQIVGKQPKCSVAAAMKLGRGIQQYWRNPNRAVQHAGEEAAAAGCIPD
jgi:hypothetical protein